MIAAAITFCIFSYLSVWCVSIGQFLKRGRDYGLGSVEV